MELKRSLLRFNYKLYVTLFFRLLIPTIYQTVRVSIIGSLADGNSLNIASQMVWVNILLEILEESALQPLYHCLGQSLTDLEGTRNKVKSGFLICTLVYSIFSAITSAAAVPLVELMAQNQTLANQTVDYIRLELIGIVASSLSKYLLLVMILHQWNAMIFISLGIQMVSSVSMDVLLVSRFGLQLNVFGVALSSIISGCTVLLVNLLICWFKLRFNLSILFNRLNLSWFKNWSRIGFFSMIDSLVRNSVYMFVVIRAMNLLNNQSYYWQANTIIWNWLLLLVLPLSDLLKQDVAKSLGDIAGRVPHYEKLLAYLFFIFLIWIIWSISIPVWPSMIAYILNSMQPSIVYNLLVQLVPCYAIFIIGLLFNSVFYSLGRTDLLAYASILCNMIVIIPYILILRGHISPTVDIIARIFGGGLILGAVSSGILYFKFIASRKVHL